MLPGNDVGCVHVASAVGQRRHPWHAKSKVASSKVCARENFRTRACSMAMPFCIYLVEQHMWWLALAGDGTCGVSSGCTPHMLRPKLREGFE